MWRTKKKKDQWLHRPRAKSTPTIKCYCCGVDDHHWRLATDIHSSLMLSIHRQRRRFVYSINGSSQFYSRAKRFIVIISSMAPVRVLFYRFVCLFIFVHAISGYFVRGAISFCCFWKSIEMYFYIYSNEMNAEHVVQLEMLSKLSSSSSVCVPIRSKFLVRWLNVIFTGEKFKNRAFSSTSTNVTTLKTRIRHLPA